MYFAQGHHCAHPHSPILPFLSQNPERIPGTVVWLVDTYTYVYYSDWWCCMAILSPHNSYESLKFFTVPNNLSYSYVTLGYVVMKLFFSNMYGARGDHERLR